MTLDLNDPDVAALHTRLAPYAAHLLQRAADYAAAQHADEVGPEHLLATLMADEICAAHRTVLFAFGDPDTIALQAQALSAGILVSGSRTTLPFSTLGVVAVRASRARAAEQREPAVRVAHVLWSSVAVLPEDLRAALEDAGFASDGLDKQPRPAASSSPVPSEGPLFRYFEGPAKQVLLQAARLAQGEDLPSIGPAHLALAALRAQPELEQPAGLSAARLRIVLHGSTEDTSPPPPVSLGPDEALVQFLAGLPPGATSLELLGRYHAGPTAELSDLLTSHKVTCELMQRTEKAYTDPTEAPREQRERG